MPKVDKENYYDFKSARNAVRRLGIKSYREWLAYRKRGDVDLRIPSNPRIFYIAEWVSWSDFFGTNNMRNSDREFLSYQEAKEYNQASGISTIEDYKNRIQDGGILDLPLAPEKYYRKIDGAFSWKDFLAPKFLPYEEAKKLAIETGLLTSAQWNKNPNMRPKGVPSNPSSYYSEEWESWSLFLGRKKA